MVALGIVFSGFFMSAAGTEAHSRPKKAYKVAAATIGSAEDRMGVGIFSKSVSKLYISNNIITNNVAGYYGGGICCGYAANPLIINNVISNNTAHSGGGGNGLHSGDGQCGGRV